MKTQDIKNMALALQAVNEKYGKVNANYGKVNAKVHHKKEDAFNDARPGTKQNQKDFDKASKMAKPKDQVSLKPMPANLAKKMAKDEGYGGMVSPETRARVKAKVAANMAAIKAKGGQAAVDKSTDITKVKGYTGPKKAEGYSGMVSPTAKKSIDKSVAANDAALKAKGKNPDGSAMKKDEQYGKVNAKYNHKKAKSEELTDEGYASAAQRAAVWADRADGGKGHPDNKKKKKSEGLWDNIRKRRESGKPKKKPGDKGYPKTLNIESVEEAMDGAKALPHMMYDPKTGKEYKAETEADHLRMKKMGYSHEKPKNEALKGGQHELDHDKDGDIDAADFKGLRNKNKKNKKSEVEVKPHQDQDKDKGAMAETTELNKLETQVKETYKGVQSGMRQAMMQMWEKASHGKEGAPAEEIDSKDSPTAKKMRADHKPEINDTEAKSHQDAADAGRAGPSAKSRSNDNMKGDKSIINPVKGAVTNGSN